MSRGSGFFYWLGLIGASMLLFWGTVCLLDRMVPHAGSAPPLTPGKGNWYRSYTKGSAIPALTYSLENGIPVIFGSSELAEDFTYQPYKYWPEKFGIPVAAFGDIGFQQMADIAALQMVASRQGYENGKIIVLISPQWFIDGKGIHPEVMNKKVFSPQNLTRLCLNRESADASRRGLVDYVSSRNELRVSSMMLSLCENYSPARQVIHTVDRIVQAGQQLQSAMDPDQDASQDRMSGWQPVGGHWSTWSGWEAEKELAIAFEARDCHNSYGVRDEYFDRYLKAELEKGNLPKNVAPPPPMQENLEYTHFLQLLDELHAFQNKPLFVLLPMNPKVYGNTQTLDPIMHQVAADLRGRQFGVLDLWSLPYVDGRLHDGGHPGALGWVEVSEAAMQYFGY
jgi:poly-D-alanine transfer protein DltD